MGTDRGRPCLEKNCFFKGFQNALMPSYFSNSHLITKHVRTFFFVFCFKLLFSSISIILLTILLGRIWSRWGNTHSWAPLCQQLPLFSSKVEVAFPVALDPLLQLDLATSRADTFAESPLDCLAYSYVSYHFCCFNVGCPLPFCCAIPPTREYDEGDAFLLSELSFYFIFFMDESQRLIGVLGGSIVMDILRTQTR